MTGMLGVGITIAVLMHLRGHYYVEGVGYATIVDVLTGGITSTTLLLELFFLKLWTTSLTLGSGGSGGVFSPSLFMGATLGGAFGILLRATFPGIRFDPAAFALAGMAGLVAGATGAALTAIVMTLEMTLDYSVVLPMTLTVAVSHGLRRMLLSQNVYTMKLVRRGHFMPEALQANAQAVHPVAEMTISKAIAVSPDDPLPDPSMVTDADAPDAATYVVVVERRHPTGVIERERLMAHPEARVDGRLRMSLARHDFVVVQSDTSLFALIASMQRASASLAVVESPDTKRTVLGVVTKSHLAEVMAEGMEIFGDCTQRDNPRARLPAQEHLGTAACFERSPASSAPARRSAPRTSSSRMAASCTRIASVARSTCAIVAPTIRCGSPVGAGTALWSRRVGRSIDAPSWLPRRQ